MHIYKSIDETPQVNFRVFKQCRNMNYNRYNLGTLEDEYRAMAEGEHGNEMGAFINTLRRFGEQCEHITELGTGHFCSTRGFLAAKPKVMVGVDVKQTFVLPNIIKLAESNNIKYTHYQTNSVEIELENTDLLLVDSLHTYGHLKKELELHHTKVNKFIIIHDMIMGELQRATNEFLEKNKEWVIIEKHEYAGGLWVLEKIQNKK